MLKLGGRAVLSALEHLRRPMGGALTATPSNLALAAPVCVAAWVARLAIRTAVELVIVITWRQGG